MMSEEVQLQFRAGRDWTEGGVAGGAEEHQGRSQESLRQPRRVDHPPEHGRILLRQQPPRVEALSHRAHLERRMTSKSR